MTLPSNTLPPVDEEKTKGRTWNGYVCPGCRTVFRVAADFSGTDVMCPSCKETLRLPKTPEEVPPHNTDPETPAASKQPAAVNPAERPQDAETSALRTMLATYDGRLKLALALLIPLALVLGAMAFFPQKKSASEIVAQENSPLSQPETTPQEKPAPPPPPIAVSEMPVPAPPAVPETREKPVPEVAVVQPVAEPAAPIAESVAQKVETSPDIPEPSPAPVAAVDAPDAGLVEAIPNTPVPAPEQPNPPPAVRPEPEIAVAPAELVHTVERGDTLNKISRKYQVSATTIKKANGMRSDAVMLGQKLKIPGAIPPAAEPEPAKIVETPAQAPQAARSHTVVRGDTLERIARKYGVEARAIMQANRIKNGVVQLGRKLVIPPAQP